MFGNGETAGVCKIQIHDGEHTLTIRDADLEIGFIKSQYHLEEDFRAYL